MPDNTFDVVSKVELPEVSNSIQQSMKEITTRFDLKDSHSQIELKEKDNKIELASKDEFKLKAVTEILQQKLVKRKVPLKALTFGPHFALHQLLLQDLGEAQSAAQGVDVWAGAPGRWVN